MVNDPAITVMLMEKLLVGDDVEISLCGGVYHFDFGGRVKQMLETKTLGRAVAMAFALANGWTK